MRLLCVGGEGGGGGGGGGGRVNAVWLNETKVDQLGLRNSGSKLCLLVFVVVVVANMRRRRRRRRRSCKLEVLL